MLTSYLAFHPAVYLGILSDYLTYILTSYLAFHPAVYLGILPDIYSHILSCILSRTVFGSGEPQKARERAFRDPLLAGETSPQDLEIRMDTGRPQGPFF